MHPTHDDDRPMTEADRTSETRFGPRPVPPGHHGPKPSFQARRVIASGNVSPDGRSSYPTPSLGAKIAVWGGVAVGVAGGTAAAVLAVRKIADAVSGSSHAKHPHRKFNAPRFVEMDEDERDAMRRRVRAQDHADRQEFSRLRAEASQHRHDRKPKAPKRKGNFVEDLIHTSTRLSESLEGVAKSLSVAMDSFRSVAGQATGVVSEFASTADQLRSALRGDQPKAAQREAGDSDRAHRL
ncbi:hypothetical protein GIY56_00150 [Paracoccus sp. YIM 132242]|uniref:Uncharacterized protein n=1 Tax=Paracoccus lichenicola TaxID=2665644 RepID=A0A6L6HHT5_9RHOB|nr:hypothetical protein [Paracoccus lichenicola]MTD98695.1 hypothetical protein [Paracoccus lichenicola]